MDLKKLTDRLERIIEGYQKEYGIETTPDWYVMKLQEEAGELTAAHLRLTGRARPKKRTRKELRANLEEEISDVIAMALLFARSRDIDVETCFRKKWFKYE